MVVCLLLSFPVHFLKVIYPFIYFWLVALCGLSLVVASRGYSSLRCGASHYGGSFCCRAQDLGTQASVVVSRRL